jgi:hypothetical protein
MRTLPNADSLDVNSLGAGPQFAAHRDLCLIPTAAGDHTFRVGDLDDAVRIRGDLLIDGRGARTRHAHERPTTRRGHEPDSMIHRFSPVRESLMGIVQQ